MKDGEIVETGTTSAVLSNPQHSYTKRLIACVPELGQGADFLERVAGLFKSENGGRQDERKCDQRSRSH